VFFKGHRSIVVGSRPAAQSPTRTNGPVRKNGAQPPTHLVEALFTNLGHDGPQGVRDGA
jgi:hypothetical protein